MATCRQLLLKGTLDQHLSVSQMILIHTCMLLVHTACVACESDTWYVELMSLRGWFCSLIIDAVGMQDVLLQVCMSPGVSFTTH